MTFRFFLDSADPDIWERHAGEGWVYGATTNPTILQRAGLACTLDTAEMLVVRANACDFEEIQLQSWGGDAASYVARGRELSALSDLVTVKLPSTQAGFEAARKLALEGVRVTMTACYTARQTAAATAFGAGYVAPYYGRMIEAGMDADAQLDAMRIAAGVDGPRILIASLRSSDQVDALIARGYDTFTLSPEIAAEMVVDPQSDEATAAFEAAAKL